ncbi:hypothetical protein NQ318_003778 [Aromia moschata]|uniref:Cytochrome P450 n=1 Tax=Aromia moschata TaxID=1265417 RepID=A0AAV8YK89_9CUCU|nr:hypothetical protein NQ318_003778 [Aromia moschata]
MLLDYTPCGASHIIQNWLGNEKSPTEWGWIRNEQCLIPKMLNKEPAPQYFFIRFPVNVRKKNDRVVSQALMFFVAGFETTSSAIAFSLYELCINPDIQERLRAEIMESIRENDGVNYDSLQEMHYLDMCVSGKFFCNK